MAATLKGIYIPNYTGKYIGKNYPTFRSSWEKRVMYMLDQNVRVVRWGSELFPVAYLNPLDSKVHQYFPDFYIEVLNNSEEVKKIIIEVKPKKQTIPPIKGKKSKKTFAIEMSQWLVNKAKWDACNNYAKRSGMQFLVLTEDNIGF